MRTSWGVSEERILPTIERLEEGGLVAYAETPASKPSRELLLTRGPELLRITEVLACATKTDHPIEPRVEQMIGKIEEVEKHALRDATVLDLVGKSSG